MKKELAKLTSKGMRLAAKNSPTILTSLGVAGLITTSVMAVRATPKALALIREEEEVKEAYLTNLETVGVVWPEYLPSVIMGGVTIACIVGANSINLRRNATLASLYSITETSLKEYKAKVKEVVGEKQAEKIKDEIASDRLKNDPMEEHKVFITGHGNTLCYDSWTGRYFMSDIELIRRTENDMKDLIRSEGFVSLNDVYFELGLDPVRLGEKVGWRLEQEGINFRYSSQLTPNGTPCLVLDFEDTCMYDYID